MYRRHRKPRSEAQHRHDSLLHRLRRDPHVYTVASQEGVSETVREYRERARKAEADVENSKKALVATEHQVGPSVSQHEHSTTRTQTYQFAQLMEKLSATTSTVNELKQALASTKRDLQTLGTRTQIPTRHMLGTLGVQTTSDSNVPSGQKLGLLKMYP